jgi:signal peptidase I
MNLDFPTILVLLTVLTGAIWAADAVLWAPKRRASVAVSRGDKAHAAPKEPVIVEYARSFFPIILIVLLLRSFLVEPFRIPSNSMMPTLLTGDFILVNKFAYGLRLPLTHTKILDLGEPQRGDVVVFRYPVDPSTDFIKRVIGVPGDRISYRNKTVYVNGKPLEQKPAGIYAGFGSGIGMTGFDIHTEHVNDVNHEILVNPNVPDFAPGCAWLLNQPLTVPPGSYFVMGDNRDQSSDSRCWGLVPEENLVGKAFFIWMNWDVANGGPNWSRIGDTIE